LRRDKVTIEPSGRSYAFLFQSLDHRVGAIGLLLLTTFSATLSPGAAYSDASVDSAYELIQGDPGLFLLDVRTQSEYEEGHIGGAYLIPYDRITSRAGELPEDKSKAILVYCRSGVRSSMAANTLVGLGYTNVTNMLGGFSEWKSKGYPYVTGPETGVKPIPELRTTPPGAILVVLFMALLLSAPPIHSAGALH